MGVPVICLKELQAATLGPYLPGARGEAEEQVLDRGRTMTRDPQVPQVGFHLPYLFATQNLYNKSCVASLEERQNFFHSRVVIIVGSLPFPAAQRRDNRVP